MLVENSVEALFARFEQDYTTKPGVVLTHLSTSGRFRMAINVLIDVATVHGAASESEDAERKAS